MDKEWSLTAIWLIFLSLGVVGLLLTIMRRWLLIPALLAVGIVAAAVLFEVRDPAAGPAIVNEAGSRYITQAYLAMAVAAALPLLGLRRRRRDLSR